MALATQCPYCHTTFRVAHDQLKLRAGLVRCGACKQVFNGTEHLLHTDAPPTPASPQRSSSATLIASGMQELPPTADKAFTPNEAREDGSQPHDYGNARNRSRADDANPAQTTVVETDPRAAPRPPQSSFDEESSDPLQRMTLMDFASFEENDNVEADDVPSGKSGHFQADDELPHSIFVQDSTETPDDLEKTIEELQNKPWRKAKKRRFFSRQKPHDDADSLEPDFVTQANRKQRMGRTLRMAMAISSAALFIALIGQAAYAFRDQISARWPKMTPALAHACAILDCRIGLPARIDMLSIESSELQAPSSDRNTFTLVALLRNRSTFAQLWPHLELTLNDANEKPVVRRVFAPRDYLPASQELGKGFTPNSEQALKLNFTLAQLTASGYRLYLFYP